MDVNTLILYDLFFTIITYLFRIILNKYLFNIQLTMFQGHMAARPQIYKAAELQGCKLSIILFIITFISKIFQNNSEGKIS